MNNNSRLKDKMKDNDEPERYEPEATHSSNQVAKWRVNWRVHDKPEGSVATEKLNMR